MQEIIITTPTIKLAAFLKLSGFVQSGGEAKEAVAAGKIKVNGEICFARGKKLVAGDTVSAGEFDCKVISE